MLPIDPSIKSALEPSKFGLLPAHLTSNSSKTSGLSCLTSYTQAASSSSSLFLSDLWTKVSGFFKWLLNSILSCCGNGKASASVTTTQPTKPTTVPSAPGGANPVATPSTPTSPVSGTAPGSQTAEEKALERRAHSFTTHIKTVGEDWTHEHHFELFNNSTFTITLVQGNQGEIDQGGIEATRFNLEKVFKRTTNFLHNNPHYCDENLKVIFSFIDLNTRYTKVLTFEGLESDHIKATSKESRENLPSPIQLQWTDSDSDDDLS